MKICPTCNKSLNDDAVFCDGCGSRVDAVQVSTANEAPVQTVPTFTAPPAPPAPPVQPAPQPAQKPSDSAPAEPSAPKGPMNFTF